MVENTGLKFEYIQLRGQVSENTGGNCLEKRGKIELRVCLFFEIQFLKNYFPNFPVFV